MSKRVPPFSPFTTDDGNPDDDDDDHDENMFERFSAVRMDLKNIFLKGF